MPLICRCAVNEGDIEYQLVTCVSSSTSLLSCLTHTSRVVHVINVDNSFCIFEQVRGCHSNQVLVV